MVIPWLTQAGALGETGGTLAASARVEEGAPYPGLSVADWSSLSSGFFHIRRLHGAGSAAGELGPVGQAGGIVRNHDDSTAPHGCKAKRMALAISYVPLSGKETASRQAICLYGSARLGLPLGCLLSLFLNRDALQSKGVYFRLRCGHEALFSLRGSYSRWVIAWGFCLRAARWEC